MSDIGSRYFYYECPDCYVKFLDVGKHQHPNGEWVENADIRRFHQAIRWSRKVLEERSAPPVEQRGIAAWMRLNAEKRDLIKELVTALECILHDAERYWERTLYGSPTGVQGIDLARRALEKAKGETADGK